MHCRNKVKIESHRTGSDFFKNMQDFQKFIQLFKLISLKLVFLLKANKKSIH